MSLIKNWLKDENIKNVTLLNKDNSIGIRKKYCSVFLSSKKIFHFEYFKNHIFSKKIDNNKELFKTMFETIRNMKFNDTHEIYVMLEPNDDLGVFCFKYTQFEDIMMNTIFGDMYIFDSNFSWTICVNHHNYLIFAIREDIKNQMKEK